MAHSGTIQKDNGKFGFIKQDSGDADMFVLAPIGGALPPLGTGVVYDVVTDAKTGRPRAENVKTEDGVPLEASAELAPQAQDRAGTLIKDNGKFGFIKQDNGEEDMFVLAPLQGVLPPLGARVRYDVVTDEKTGRPRAENVEEERGGQQPRMDDGQFQQTQPSHYMESGGLAGSGSTSDSGACTGTMLKDNGSFGFIQQDSGEEDMFVLPPLLPLGTRVAYDVVSDPKTGRPRAESVRPLSHAVPTRAPAAGMEFRGSSSELRAGSMVKHDSSGKFGFIQQDSGEEDMFTLAPIGGILPALGARLVYEVVLDAKTGRPRAENVRPEYSPVHHPHQVPHHAPHHPHQVPHHAPPFAYHAAPSRGHPHGAPAARGKLAGTMLKDNGKFGFIQQDNGEEDMFVLAPIGGGALPPLGSRVLYDVVMDAKTGRPRAENVEPEPMHYAHPPHRPLVMPMHAHAPPPQHAYAPPPQHAYGPPPVNAGKRTGSILKDNGKFGFIQQDSGEEDMFVLAPFGGGALPPVGTRVAYEVVMDAKTGRPRAENLEQLSAIAGYGAAAKGKGKDARSQPYNHY